VWQALAVGHVLLDAPAAVWRASRAGSPFARARLARVTPLLAVGALATAAGTARGGLPRDGVAERAANLRRRLRLRRAWHVVRSLWSP
ncbi:MAG: hypothetical protein ACXWZ1_11145, partial [Gaiellaceae bacterium]